MTRTPQYEGNTVSENYSPDSTASLIMSILIVAAVIVAIVFLVEAYIGTERFIRKNITRRIRDDERRDRVRTYTRAQREDGMRRCGHQCEGTGLFFRCQYRGSDLHGDHWYPHARGGATTIRNLVMLCPTCNKKKSAKIPSRVHTLALSIRRSIGINYVNPEKKIGEWLPRRYGKGTESIKR